MRCHNTPSSGGRYLEANSCATFFLSTIASYTAPHLLLSQTRAALGFLCIHAKQVPPPSSRATSGEPLSCTRESTVGFRPVRTTVATKQTLPNWSAFVKTVETSALPQSVILNALYRNDDFANKYQRRLKRLLAQSDQLNRRARPVDAASDEK